jgi:RNA polymerase sigma-70 factor (ECF subfamily)
MDSISEIAKEYGGLVTALSLRMIQDGELAKDAAQEAWAEIIAAYPSFEGRSKVSTWVYAIASRVILRHATKEKRHTVAYIEECMTGEEIPYPGGASETDWTRSICDSCITGSLHCLSNRDRLAYLLYEAAGLGSEEAGSLLGMSQEALRKSVSRSRSKLHSFLDGKCVLYNPSGSCRCRMAGRAGRVGLSVEFRKVESAIREISFLAACDEVLSERDAIFKKISHEMGSPLH